MRTIEEAESEFEVRVQGALKELDLLPEGYMARVRFHGKQRDKRRTASIDTFSPETDSVRISFEPVAESAYKSVTPASMPNSAEGAIGTRSDDPVSDLIRALDRAEGRPGYDFISLKWFRDTALVAEGFEWALSPEQRQCVLRAAIENRLVLTSKVPNPKNPQYPVTAIRLNRLLPQVKASLGQSEAENLDFHPVKILGEPLSATILQERR
jgi:hypothetical protein